MKESITPNDKESHANSLYNYDTDLSSVLGSDFEISEDLILKAKSIGNCKCFMIIDDKYILIDDGKSLISEIEKCEKLRKSGVNYCGPISYKEYDGKYYFIEHRAPGLQLDFYDYHDNIKFDEAFKEYFSYLGLLSKTPQELYNKFFSNIEAMRKESLKPDCCSLGNLFFDPQVGFSFIDVYPCNIRPGDARLSVSDIFKIILNPKFSYNNFNIIPKEEVDKYNETIKIIYDKIIIGLKTYGYSDEEINSYLNSKIHVFSDKECVSYNDIEKYIKEHYNRHEMVWRL